MPRDEIADLEKYNADQNEVLFKRPVTNLICCQSCNGKGSFFSAVCTPCYWKCKICNGSGYI